MPGSGINASSVKLKNRLLALQLLCMNPNVSRTDLTSLTGLTKMTLSNIISELVEKGLVVQREDEVPLTTGAGRKPVALGIAPSAPKLLGIYIARNGLHGVVTDMHLNLLARRIVALGEEETSASLETKLVSLTQELIESTDSPIAGIGVCCVGIVDAVQGFMLAPMKFYGIKNFSVQKALSRFGLPVLVQNDANAGALVEKYFGQGKSAKDFVYVSISRGIGAGIVVQNNLFYGSSGYAGELGHVPVDGGTEYCYCGRRGCLELYSSTPRLLDSMEKVTGQRFSHIRDAVALYDLDGGARKVFDEFLEAFSCGLLNLCNMFDPALLVIGHDGAYLSDPMLRKLSDIVNQKALTAQNKTIGVVRAHYGDQSALMGAATQVLDGIFAGYPDILGFPS